MADQIRPGSEFNVPPRKFKDLGDGSFAETLALEPGSIGGGGGGGGLTDTQLRATPVPVTIPTPTPVSDNGGSLTVDGTVAISNPTANPETGLAKDATLTTRLPAALDADGGLKGHIQNFPASQAVTGPLTDTQLRATPVPISGTVTATGPLTDTQLRASAVPVSGTVTVSNPTTNPETGLAKDVTLAALSALVGTAVDSPGAYTLLDRLSKLQSINNQQLTALKTLVANSAPKVIPKYQSTLLHRSL